jgi:Zn-finger nucleic acid-binding protein
MRCPKQKNTELVASKLDHDLKCSHCQSCKGYWLSADDYEAWRSQQNKPKKPLSKLDFSLEFKPSEYDSKAGLCPECGSYLARTRIDLQEPFYLERCPGCGGMWLDQGEWEVIKKLNLHVVLPHVFSSQWQIVMREMLQAEQERKAVVEKLGKDLAEQLFKLTDAIESHEHGDFAAAYIMRRFDRDKYLEMNLES